MKYKKVQLKWKIYNFSEITVWEYFLFLMDYEQFLDQYFWKYGIDYQKISPENVLKICNEIFPIQKSDNELEALITEEKDIQTKENIKDFRRGIWKFIQIFHIPYSDVLNIPLSEYIAVVDDIEYITGEKEEKKSTNFSGSPEKEKLKQLFGNQ